MIPAAQAQAAALLRKLAGSDPAETRISALFIGSDTVWKLRKAVRLSFLDFTDPAERHRTALRELELNVPHAPALYRDVVAVTHAADGGLALGGAGEAVDWVVRMARIPPADFLDEIAARGPLSSELLDAIGDSVAALHGGLPPISRDQPAALRKVARDNLASALAAGLDPQRARQWAEAMQKLLDAKARWLTERNERGFVRRLHGDLHLGNMALWHSRPVPFDALEFSEEMATFDVGYDLAFLLMDLDRRAGRPAANRVLNRYLARTGDCELVGGLPPFLSMRAMIRGHVEAAAQGADSSDSRDYLARALEFQHSPPALVLAVGGLPASGKSTLAREVAPLLGAAPGAVVLRSDEIRKRQNNVAPEIRLPPSAYSEPSSREVFAELMRAARDIVGAGHAVIADATFMAAADRQAIRHAAGGSRFVGVWLQAPLAVLEARIQARTGDASDADLAVLRCAAENDPGPGGWLAVDATDLPSAVTTVIAALRSGAGPIP